MRPGAALVTPRLRLEPLSREDAEALAAGRRRPTWAADYPEEGDVTVARLFLEHPPETSDEVRFGFRAMVERESGLVVGGVGFRGPPRDGAVELGYGVVASRRGRGLVTEAVRALVADAFADDRVAVVLAGVRPDNSASVGVLVRCGFAPDGADGELLRFRLDRVAHSAG